MLNELETGDIVGFKGFLRMTPDVFNELLAKIEPHIRRSDTIMRDSITPHEMLVVTLRYLATGRTVLHSVKHFLLMTCNGTFLIKNFLLNYSFLLSAVWVTWDKAPI